ncbi:ArsR family transcriptional regulator [Cellulomonas bogoriensis 69B4 = DSM 16987]|uniref:ArsR family transcriptional regulator n=1 Tax=Cellulomonas bogoriensis 69B4 = DSM 16987 TaxID=1386082 RepID=A0A0A0C0N2_9CELL|nr:ArsR family transcriptional regulator [Cellulomonas bogoriensis 69B4 = DSM 16987]
MRAAAELFKALSSPARLRLLIELQRGPACVHELVQALGVSQSLVSQHLRVLRGAKLVSGDRRGKEIVYTLKDTHVSHLITDALAHAHEPAAPAGPEPAGPDQRLHSTAAHTTTTGAHP